MGYHSFAADLLLPIAKHFIDGRLASPTMTLVEKLLPKASDSVAASVMCVLLNKQPETSGAWNNWFKHVHPLLDTDPDVGLAHLRRGCLTTSLAMDSADTLGKLAKRIANAGGLATANDVLLDSFKFLHKKPDSREKKIAVTLLSEAITAINVDALNQEGPTSNVVAQAERVLGSACGIDHRTMQETVSPVIIRLAQEHKWDAAQGFAQGLAHLTGNPDHAEAWSSIIYLGGLDDPKWAMQKIDSVLESDIGPTDGSLQSMAIRLRRDSYMEPAA